MSGNYILDDAGNPIEAPDLTAWAEWYERSRGSRHVRKETIGDVLISTVFLSLDHSFGDGPPVLWETMIFGGEHDEYQERYCTRAEAVAGHARAVAMVKGATREPLEETT